MENNKAEVRVIGSNVAMRRLPLVTAPLEKVLWNGTVLEPLSNEHENGYVHVKTKDGRTGYVLATKLNRQPQKTKVVPPVQQEPSEVRTATQELRQVMVKQHDKQHGE